MNETLATLHKLTSTRAPAFSEREVRDEDVRTILAASVRAANASARQSYSIVVVDPELQFELEWPGKRALLFCVDFTRLSDTAERLRRSFAASHLMQFVTGVIDTSLAVQNAVVAATSLGIGSLITNRVYSMDLAKAKDLLQLPSRGCFPLVAVCLGYPTQEATPKGRLSGTGIVHWGTYKRLTDGEKDEIIALYDDPDAHVALGVDWRSQGWSHYLDWFYEKWCARVGTQEAAGAVAAYLREQGFLDDVQEGASAK